MTPDEFIVTYPILRQNRTVSFWRYAFTWEGAMNCASYELMVLTPQGSICGANRG